MDDRDRLAERFEAHRPRLRAVAQRLLGSAAEADDAVQEAWLRLQRTDPGSVDNLGGWLTTVVARVCLDMLRARGSRRGEPLEGSLPDRVADSSDRVGPEGQALLADSVGPAMLAREGDFEALLALLDPEVVVRADTAGGTRVVRGAAAVASQALGFAWRARSARPVLVDGMPGVVAVRHGRPAWILTFTVADGRITGIRVLAGTGRLGGLELAEL
jgi:hypothetical protein